MVEDLERINKVEQLLVDTKELMRTIDNMYYKKGYDKIEEFKELKDFDNKFRRCRLLMMRNLEKVKKHLDLGFNLTLALQIHLTVINNEMKKIQEIEQAEEKIIEEVKNIEDDSVEKLTIRKLKIEDVSTTEESEDSDDEVGKLAKTILDIESSDSE